MNLLDVPPTGSTAPRSIDEINDIDDIDDIDGVDAGRPLPPPDPATAARPALLDDPPWYRRALCSLLAITTVAYVWGLSASGWANSFYSAASQAGSQSWKAWFFGSFDAANSITVDKPPASLWVTGLSVRIFGLNSWAILVPEALMGAARWRSWRPP